MNELQTVNEHILVPNKPSKRQRRFVEVYFDPNSETFGNAYRSAIEAGFSEKSARVITGNTRGLEWVKQAMALYASQFEPEHIYLGLQQIAAEGKQDRDKIRALELLAKIRGMFIERSQSEVNVSFKNDVPRPINPIVEPITPHEEGEITQS